MSRYGCENRSDEWSPVHISIRTLMYGWPPVFCQPAYAKLIMLIELDHGVIRKIGLFINPTLTGFESSAIKTPGQEDQRVLF